LKSDTRTLHEILVGDRRFIVPIYQRPYVWERERQWEPLWDDIEATVLRLLEARSNGFNRGLEIAVADKEASPHFLGAIVLEQSATATGDLESRLVVDGQQRLATIQLLLRGVLESLVEIDADRVLRNRLAKAVRNDETVGYDAGELLKLTPRLAEVQDFAEAMEDEHVEPSSSIFSSARDYFLSMSRDFLHDDTVPIDPYHEGSPQSGRAAVLVAALLGLLKLVVIDLDQVDDAQIIFEALNARNTPLSATDLVKNLLFLRAQAEHSDPEQLYTMRWKRFDDDADWWLRLSGIGHAQRANQDWLLGHWLTAQLGRSVNVGRLYTEFRSWLDRSGLKAFDALSTLNQFADAYEILNERLPGLSEAERRASRNIDRLNITVAAPVLMWLLVLPIDMVSPYDRELAFRALESFVIRRMAAKLQTRGYGQVFVDVLAKAQDDGESPARAVVAALQSGPNNYQWPTDDDLLVAFSDGRYYGPGGINQDRLRLLLGAVEDQLQRDAKKGEAVEVDYSSLQVEHILPQNWRETWPVVVEDRAGRVVAELERQQHINRIGNLTLVAGPLNAAVSNNPWEMKQRELGKYTRLEMNRRLLGEGEWNETKIVARGQFLASVLNSVWPGPGDPLWGTEFGNGDGVTPAKPLTEEIQILEQRSRRFREGATPGTNNRSASRGDRSSTVPRGTGSMTCRVCGRTMPETMFPTTTPDRRGTECRPCRDARRGYGTYAGS
jgi:hypothetical protein